MLPVGSYLETGHILRKRRQAEIEEAVKDFPSKRICQFQLLDHNPIPLSYEGFLQFIKELGKNLNLKGESIVSQTNSYLKRFESPKISYVYFKRGLEQFPEDPVVSVAFAAFSLRIYELEGAEKLVNFAISINQKPEAKEKFSELKEEIATTKQVFGFLNHERLEFI